jgi:hypothetical protein
MQLFRISMLLVPATLAAPALAGVVTVTGPDAPAPFSQVSDAMAWISAQGGSNAYSVHASAGRYQAFEVVDNATLTWGASPGVIDVGGNFRVRSSGQMLFELGGTSNANAPTTGLVEYDTVLVDGGNVNYQGRLTISLVNGFVPLLGQSFQLIAATGSVTWDLATAVLDAPALGGGLAWQVSVGPSTFGSPVGFGTFTNALFVTVVPTPGAAAMLGLAGFVGGGRRRRN